jgi:hypothetical protein
MMNAEATYPTLQWAVPVHPTVSELIPTVLGDLRPVEAEERSHSAAEPAAIAASG